MIVIKKFLLKSFIIIFIFLLAKFSIKKFLLNSKPNTFLYTIESKIDNLSIFLTLNDENKALKCVKIAENKLNKLNTLNENDVEQINKLYNEFHNYISKANLYLASSLTKNKINNEKVNNIEENIKNVETKQANINPSLLDKLTADIKKQSTDIVESSKLTLFRKITNIEEANYLRNEGLNYSEILKLETISELTDTSINELLTIEDFIICNDKNEKVINNQKVLDLFGISKKQFNNQFNNYKQKIKSVIKEKLKKSK